MPTLTPVLSRWNNQTHLANDNSAGDTDQSLTVERGPNLIVVWLRLHDRSIYIEDQMLLKVMTGAALAVSLMSGTALAHSSTVNGAAGGAVTGAIVGGPAGAAVGGVSGAIVGTAIDPPPHKTKTYVQQAPAPTTPVVIKERVVVGQQLPGSVVVTPTPDDPGYAYAIVHDGRVIVEPSSRKVIKLIK